MNKWLLSWLTASSCLLFTSSSGQSFYGIVIDKESKNPLPYASVGVKGKSIGGIADRSGKFNINISQAAPRDSIIISYGGYEDVRILINELVLNTPNEISLQPKAKTLKEVIIVSKRDLLVLGNMGYGSRFTGWGDYKSSRGRLRGLRIKSKEFPVRITQFAVRFKDNEFDSVRLRLHIQNYQPDSSQGEDLLQEAVFFTVIKNQNWAYVDLAEYNIVVTRTVIVAVEWVDAWAPQKTSKSNYIFTFSLDKKKGYVYVRNTSEEPYSVNFDNETPTMYLKGYKTK